MGFFDFDKVQKDFLSAALKAQKKGTPGNWFTCEDTEKHRIFISDGHFLAIVPDKICCVQAGGKGRKIKPEAIKMPEECDLKPVADTGMRKDITSPVKATICILKAQDAEEEIWINKKYLDYFSGMNYRIMGTGAKAPIMLYVLDVAVGMIMPINHK